MGIFHRSPLFGYNSAEQKTLFCVFLCFRNLTELKLTWVFSSVNILSREPSGAQEVNEVDHYGQTSTGGATTRPDRTTHAHLGLEAPMPSIFVS
jgi:hypothetical protein